MNVGIVGNGYVGQGTKLLDNESTNFFIYDLDEQKRYPDSSVTLDTLVEKCELVFVCVPTPMYVSGPSNDEGGCCVKIVESVVIDLRTKGYPPSNIVIRSTVPVGTSESLNVNFMPEFLSERNWQNDVKNATDWVIGCSDPDDQAFKDKVNLLLDTAPINKEHNRHFVTTSEAEMSKYVRNCYLATKISYFNEVKEFCNTKNVDWENVRELTILDDRVGESHTHVPGPDGKGGFGGTCFPKDISAFRRQMIDSGMKSWIVDAAHFRNLRKDRPEMDWMDDRGRAVI